ncbi:uncharacterized protein LOC144625467 [Crassostrea virginica]
MKGILIFLLCSSVVEAENCPSGWTEFCAQNLFYGCYKAYLTRVNYSTAYSVCDLNEYSSVLFQYDSQALEEMDFVSNLTDSKTIWLNNGQSPTICSTMSGHNQTIVQENCNNSAYAVCKYQSDKYLSTTIECSSAVLTTLSPSNGTTTNLTENTTNIIQYTRNILVNTTRTTVVETISTDSMETSSSLENIYTTNSPANQTTTCVCEWLCYTEFGVDDLEIKVQSIKQNLTVNKGTLSATLRKLTCAPDPRPSSTYIGYTGATIMSLLFLVIVVIDCLPRPKK